mgnify:CR=1 FL=1|tara:strand:- start:149 stop:1108 length:960 start_codon:yes stop_codon:yes gene_type:complete
MPSDVLEEMKETNYSWLKQIFMIGLPLSAIIILTIFSDLHKISLLLKKLSIGTVFILVLISILRPIIGGLRASFVYRPIGNLSVINASKGYVLSAYGTIFFPSAVGGDIFRIEHIKNCTGGTRKEAFLVAGLERVVGFLCLLIIAILISFFELPFLISTTWFLFVIFTTIIGVFIGGYIFIKYKTDSIFIQAKEYVKGYATPILLCGVFILSLIFQCVSLSIPVLVGYSLGGVEVAITIALMTPFIALFSTIPISIGGLGLREASYVGLGTLGGIENEISFLAGLSLSASIILSGLPGVLFQRELFESEKFNPMPEGSE